MVIAPPRPPWYLVLERNVTIERRGRKGRKETPYFLAAFAAFAFQGGVGWSDTLLEKRI